MKLTKRQLKRIIKEERQKLLEVNISDNEVDQIIDPLTVEVYDVLEECAYDLAEAFGSQIESEDAGYIVAVLLKVIVPKLKEAGVA